MTTQENGQSNDSKPTSNVPEWVKSDLFEEILKTKVNGYRQIRSFKAASGLGAGENYATIMLRIEIEVELNDDTIKPVSYVLKVPHQNEMYEKMIEKNNIFETEFLMFNNIVPEFEQLYKDVGIEITFGAHCLEIPAPGNYVLLEDLRTKGFKNADRLAGLDNEHTQFVLRKLAQWHAASAVHVVTKGPFPSKVEKGYFAEDNTEIMEEMFKPMGEIFIKCCETYIGNEAYIEDVKALQNSVIDRVVSLGNIDPNEFNVLNHGDCWTNNIMFQYDENGKVNETYLVDYQVPKYGSPAQDLLYFLISSPTLEVKLNKFDYYIKYYHDILSEHLKLLNYSKHIPTLRELHISIIKHGFWGKSNDNEVDDFHITGYSFDLAYLVMSGVMAAVLLDPSELSSFENFVSSTAEGEKFKYLMFSNPRYRKHVEAILPWLQNRGLLE